MNSQILNKLTPEGREKIIYLEAELRKCEEDIAEIDRLLALSYQTEMLEEEK